MANSLPANADAVIVGGGVIGCSVLYHLMKAGVSNVVLLERYKIASGTTFHSAALVPPLAPTRAETALAKYSIDLYASLEAETGQSTGWRKCGHLNLAASKDRLEALKRYVSVLHARGVEGDLISPSEVKAKWPLLNTDDVEAAIWMPDSGRVDPTDLCQALLKGGRQRGGKLFEDTPVVAWIIRDGKVKGVRTPAGDIACDVVVNCTGLWGREIGRMAGVSVPLFACEHFYLLTDKIEGIHRDLPALRDADAHLYMREDVGGMLVGCFEPNPKPLPLESLPEAPFTLLNEDWDHFEPRLQGAIKRIPALATTGSRQLVNGPESFTMDHSPLLGEASEVEGFFVACGMNSFGITMAGGVGWVMADWITKGCPEVDVSNLDIRRFAKSQDNLRALSCRIPEVLAHHHAIPWPNHDYETVRGIRRSPFHPVMKDNGAFFSERGGWERPLWFSAKGKPQRDKTFGRPAWFESWAGEHRAARDSVAIFDGSPLAKILVQGRDAPSFLNRVMAQEMNMPVGTARYSLMLNEGGGIESDPMVCRVEETSYLITTGSAQGRRDATWLRRRIRKDEAVVVTDVSPAYATLMVAGPASRQLIAAYSSDDVSDQVFPHGTVREIEIAYTTALAIRFSYTGELGFELHIASDAAQSVLETLLSGTGGLHPRVGGLAALNSLRLEKGFRSWGHDIGPSDRPGEAGLSFAAKLKKAADFVGRAAVLKENESSTTRRLLSFVFEGNTVFPHGEEAIYRNGQPCGALTSASFGHSIGKPVALGWIEGGSTSPESVLADRFEVEVASARYPVSPHFEAPYDPLRQRPLM